MHSDVCSGASNALYVVIKSYGYNNDDTRIHLWCYYCVIVSLGLERPQWTKSRTMERYDRKCDRVVLK